MKKKLIGKWVYENGSIQKDEVSKQIEWLINNHLKRIAADKSGWDVLYIDPNDNSLWELTFPESEMQGGGAPSLICISNEVARKKYLHSS